MNTNTVRWCVFLVAACLASVCLSVRPQREGVVVDGGTSARCSGPGCEDDEGTIGDSLNSNGNAEGTQLGNDPVTLGAGKGKLGDTNTAVTSQQDGDVVTGDAAGAASASGAKQNQMTQDVFNEEFAHLHVHPSTHRNSLKKDDAKVPTLMVTLAIRSPAEVLQFTLPVGYQVVPVPGLQSACGVWTPEAHAANTETSVYARETKATPLTQHVMSCEVSTWNASFPTRILLKLCDGISGLSIRPTENENGPVLTWWYFHLQAWNPDESPQSEDNFFELHWAPHNGQGWAGSTIFEGWPVLGDWDCVYSDWEGWGSCSTRCGGGKEKHTRRVLMRPPPDGTGNTCTDVVEETVDCNTHPCIAPCEFVDEVLGNCTADCGGGVQIHRSRWRGEECPKVQDVDTMRLEPCNTQPCTQKCQLADDWTVATECSERCGVGHFWMFQRVVEQHLDDKTCVPNWRRLPCLRLACTPLTVLRPDRNIMPEPKDAYTAGIFFKPTVTVRKLQLTAPDGFRFGPPGSVCVLKGTDTLEAHDMIPYYEGCKVGNRPNQAILSFSEVMPPWEGGDLWYHFMIDVINPSCANENWVADGYFQTLRCDMSADRNRWTIELAEAGTTAWSALNSEGYAIYAPPEALHGSSDMSEADYDKKLLSKVQNEEWTRPETDLQEVLRAAGEEGQHRRWKSRPTFCSKRFPCPDASACSEEGVCPRASLTMSSTH